jgi:hypothetical protein
MEVRNEAPAVGPQPAGLGSLKVVKPSSESGVKKCGSVKVITVGALQSECVRQQAYRAGPRFNGSAGLDISDGA